MQFSCGENNLVYSANVHLYFAKDFERLGIEIYKYQRINICQNIFQQFINHLLLSELQNVSLMHVPIEICHLHTAIE